MSSWRQAASAELARALGLHYAQALIDLVKAFDRVPHRVLFREAERLGYPLWLLRLALATYRMRRVVRIGTVLSKTIIATRGMTAESGFAITEILFAMYDIVVSAHIAHPAIHPFLFVDDLCADARGWIRHIRRELIGFLKIVSKRIRDDGAKFPIQNFCLPRRLHRPPRHLQLR